MFAYRQAESERERGEERRQHRQRQTRQLAERSSLGRRRRRDMQNGGNNATKEINLKFHHKRENEIT